MLSGFLADALIARGVPVGLVRKSLQTVSMVGPAVCLVLAARPGVSPGEASNLITVGLGLSALSLGAVSVSQLDIAPKTAGLVFGIGNTAGTLAGLLSTPVTGWMLEATHSWALVFGVTAAHYVVGAIVWCIWAGDRDPDAEIAGEPARAP